MLKSKNCIRTGQVLLDENLHAFLLCNSCHMDFRIYTEFCKHLEKCEGVQHIFHDDLLLKYDTKNCEQIKRKTGKIIKQYLIYNIADVELLQKQSSQLKPSKPLSKALPSSTPSKYLNVMRIEEELLNPCWYTNDNDNADYNHDPKVKNLNSSHVTGNKKAIQYDKLVEAVTPFVQFKENAKNLNNHSNNIRIAKPNSDQLKSVKTNNTAGDQTAGQRSIDIPPTRAKSKLMNKRLLYIALNSNENTQTNLNDNKGQTIATNCTKIPNIKIMNATSLNARHLTMQQPPKQQQKQNPQLTQLPNQTNSTETLEAKRPRLADATVMSVKPENVASTATSNKRTSQAANTAHKSTNLLVNPMVINLNTSSSSSASSVSSTSLASPIAATLPLKSAKPATVNKSPPTTIPNTKENQTAQILNKLQTLGLQIKRTKPPAVLAPGGMQFGGKTDRKILELLNKLQSKGTKVTILKSSTSSKSNNNQLHPISIPVTETSASNYQTNAITELSNVNRTAITTANRKIEGPKSNNNQLHPISISVTEASASKHQTNAITELRNVTKTTTTTTTTTLATRKREGPALTTKSCEAKCKLPLSKNIIVKKIK